MTGSIEKAFPLSELNYLHLKAHADYFVDVTSVAEIRAALKFAHENALDAMVLGEGSNVVFSGDFKGLVIKISLKGIELEEDNSGTLLKVAAGELWNDVVNYALERDLYGLENLAQIPGTAGAAPIQNIGAYGVELKDVLHDLQIIEANTLGEATLANKECRFGYRDSVFKHELAGNFVTTSIRLRVTPECRLVTHYGGIADELQAMKRQEPTGVDIARAVTRIRKRRLPDPKEYGNVGSFFKNPSVSLELFDALKRRFPAMPSHPNGDRVKLSAAWLIEECGLKGTKIGDAQISARHALVLINLGNASARNILDLAELVQTTVANQYGLDLEIEPLVTP
jgi:UDP-N-acetylmuramate dehydrogenase